MSDQLYELDPGQIRVNQPLLWDVFSAHGKLLLHRGSVIQSDDQRDRLLALGMYISRADLQKAKVDIRPRVYDPFHEWDDLRRRLPRLNLAFMHAARAPAPNPELLAELDGVVDRITTLVLKVPDIAIFEIMQMDLTNYVVSHHLQAAALTVLVAQKLSWSAQAARNVCRAALTMNVAMLDLQTVLAAQKQPITPAQREAISGHGIESAKLLRTLGVGDPEWLRAVAEHHPDDLGPGARISAMGSLVHHVDVYLAKISPRAYRAAKTPHAAARELMQDEQKDKVLVSLLIKIIGIYPPGTYVKLACGEIAVVVRRGDNAHTPRVCSLMSAAGMPLGEPAPRDTTQAKYAVESIVGKSKVMVLVDRQRLYGMSGVLGLAAVG